MLSSPRAVKLTDINEDSFRTIPANQPEEEVAYAFNQYHLISAPVTDDDGRLVGVITIDDAMVVLDEEHEEDTKCEPEDDEEDDEELFDFAASFFITVYFILLMST